MTNVLLKELNSSDVDWIIAVGQPQDISPDTVILQAGNATETLHIILEGSLAVTVPQADDNPLSKAFSRLENNQNPGREVIRLTNGEVIGEVPFLVGQSPMITVKAIEPSRLVSIPQAQLAAKLKQDIGFAARFYRAIAILFSHRLQRVIRQMGRSKLTQARPIREVLFVLSALNDSDIDWLMASGQRRKVAANTVLIREGGTVDGLCLLLDGLLSVSVAEAQSNPLTRVFAALEGEQVPAQELTRLSPGEIIGETPFIDADLPLTTVSALTDSLVLAIPRQQLAAKLQQDIGFASRFYRVIATLLSNRLQQIFGRLGYGRRTYSKGLALDQASDYEDELDPQSLDQMAFAGKRFDWMLNRLKNS